MPDHVSALTLVVESLYLVENLILLYVFLTPRRTRAFQAAALIATTALAYAIALNPGPLGLEPPVREYALGCLYLIPCILIFEESLQAKIFVFFMNFSLTQFIYLISVYLDRGVDPPMPRLCVVAGLALGLAALPLIRRRARAPARDIVGLLGQGNASLALFPVLSFALLAYYGAMEYRPSALVPIVLSAFLIFFTYYLLAASIAVVRRQEELERISDSDGLTGIYNRRHMERRIGEELERRRRTGSALSLAMIDIDLFKRVNDEFGHDCGDFVLREIVKDVAAAVRAHDILARWGGEEFIILLPATGGEQAARLAERIRQRIEERRYRYGGESLSLTVTIGLAVARPDDVPGELVKRADLALYGGKRGGRNRVILFDDRSDGR
jgi:diguanylate cyclase (GGDEF)-like protein